MLIIWSKKYTFDNQASNFFIHDQNKIWNHSTVQYTYVYVVPEGCTQSWAYTLE